MGRYGVRKNHGQRAEEAGQSVSSWQFSEWARIEIPNISLSGIGAPSVCVPESVIPSAGVGALGTSPFFRVLDTGGSFA